ALMRLLLEYQAGPLLLLVGFRLVAALRVHLAEGARRWHPTVKRMIRSAAVMPFDILLETQKLAVAALLILMVLFVRNPLEMNYKLSEPLPLREFVSQLHKPESSKTEMPDFNRSFNSLWA